MLVGAAAIALAFELPEATAVGGPGARFLPLVLGAIVTLLGAGIALAPAEPPPPGAEAAERAGSARVWGTLGAVAAYAFLFEGIGFLVATVVFLVTLLLLYGERRWPVVAGVAMGATAATYAVFALWLKVPLPRGVLEPWTR